MLGTQLRPGAMKHYTFKTSLTCSSCKPVWQLEGAETHENTINNTVTAQLTCNWYTTTVAPLHSHNHTGMCKQEHGLWCSRGKTLLQFLEEKPAPFLWRSGFVKVDSKTVLKVKLTMNCTNERQILKRSRKEKGKENHWSNKCLKNSFCLLSI